MVFSIFTRLYNHHHCLIWGHAHCPKQKPHSCCVIPHPSSTHPLATINLLPGLLFLIWPRNAFLFFQEWSKKGMQHRLPLVPFLLENINTQYTWFLRVDYLHHIWYLSLPEWWQSTKKNNCNLTLIAVSQQDVVQLQFS